MTKKTMGGGSVRSGSSKRQNRKAAISKAQPFPAKKKMGTASTNPDRVLPRTKKAGFYRDKAKINLLNMYNKKPDLEKMREQPLDPMRIQPDRRWFGNTRVITQTKLEQFREAMENARKDPYSVILKRSKLPVSLFHEEERTKGPRVNLLSMEPFAKTFGKKQLRKRAKIGHESLNKLAVDVGKRQLEYNESEDQSIIREEVDARDAVSEEVFKKGTSRRIWQELYKVVDSSDVIIQVLDARDPMGTRCKHLENHIRKDRPNKHVVLLLNKSDLIPAWAASRWVKVLGSEYPTVAFHSSLTNPFGKMTLMNLLRQYAGLLKDRKHVSVGFIGYPNVGKSSVINTLRKKKVCKAAPVPGETKVWQYVALTHRVYLIDCPGVVPGDTEVGDETARVLKGVVRAEKIGTPEQHIDEVLNRAKRVDLIKRYELGDNVQWENADEFLTLVAKRKGRLLKGGEPDISTTARVVIYDWQRGRIPFFVPPPFRHRDEKEEEEENETEKEDEETEKEEIEKEEIEKGEIEKEEAEEVSVPTKVNESFVLKDISVGNQNEDQIKLKGIIEIDTKRKAESSSEVLHGTNKIKKKRPNICNSESPTS